MKRVTKYGNTNNKYRITNANTKNIRVTNADERGVNYLESETVETETPAVEVIIE